MKLLSILRYYPMYSETFVYQELAELRRQGVPLMVLAMRERPARAFLTQADLAGPLETLPRQMLSLSILAGAWRLWKRHPERILQALRWGLRHLRFKDCLKAIWMADWCLQQGISHLHIHFAGEGAEVAELIRQCVGIPFRITLHARDLFVPRPSVRDLLERAELLTCISEFNRRYLLQTFGPHLAGKSVVARLGVRLPSQCIDLDPEPKQCRVIAVSRLVEKKGLATLLHALARLQARGIPIHALIAGEGPLRQDLERLRRSLALESRVRLPGALPHLALEQELRAGISAYVQPAVVARDGDQDGIPVALMEAMALGLPVVTTRVSGIPELVEPGISGILVAPGDPDALAEAILRLWTDPALRRRLGAGARARIEAGFRLDQSVAHLRRVWQESASGNVSRIL